MPLYTHWFQLLRVTQYITMRSSSKNYADIARCWKSLLGEVLLCPSASSVFMHLPSKTTFVFLPIYESVRCGFWFICPGECSGLPILVKEVSLTFMYLKVKVLYFVGPINVAHIDSSQYISIYQTVALICMKMCMHPRKNIDGFVLFFVNATSPYIPLILSEGKITFLLKRQKRESGPSPNWHFNQAISLSFCHLLNAMCLKFFILFIL